MTDVDPVSPQIPDDVKKPGPNPLVSLIPDDIKKPAQRAIQKLTSAADGVPGTADDLEKIVDRSLEKVEQKLDSFLDGLDKFLGKF
jgi:hypothetical protein